MTLLWGIVLIVVGFTLLWAIWQAHKGFWQSPRDDPQHAQRRQDAEQEGDEVV
jgi:uncharacterized iron-regulated membrane protein